MMDDRQSTAIEPLESRALISTSSEQPRIAPPTQITRDERKHLRAMVEHSNKWDEYLALQINRKRRGWAWPNGAPAYLGLAQYTKQLLDWMGQQSWWSTEVATPWLALHGNKLKAVNNEDGSLYEQPGDTQLTWQEVWRLMTNVYLENNGTITDDQYALAIREMALLACRHAR